MNPRLIRIDDFDYELPESRIAKFPSEQRGGSKLLVSNSLGVKADMFSNIASHIPVDSLIVFNETKVIHARLIFKKETGAMIEIFLLEPSGDKAVMEQSLASKSKVQWNCLVGNSKKWKDEQLEVEVLISGQKVIVTALRIEIGNSYHVVSFSWDSDHCFGEIIESLGKIPLPPYIKRDTVFSDSDRYQTIYARNSGSVAAPTAGLHFTNQILKELSAKGVKCNFITLNVGAGTFKPVSADKMSDHDMHVEKVFVSRQVVCDIMKYKHKGITAVGTTTTRTLESLYLYGLMLESNPGAEFRVNQWLPYDIHEKISLEKSMNNVLSKMNELGVDFIEGESQLIIAPGYEFKVVDRLITNFHQPKSTLLLLVSAFCNGRWKNDYKFALENNFMFLSYGDSCIFLP